MLADARIPTTLPDGSADIGLVIADDVDADRAIANFIGALGLHRHFERENNPPLV